MFIDLKNKVRTLWTHSDGLALEPLEGQSSRVFKHQKLKAKRKRVDRMTFLILSYVSSFLGIALVAILNEKIFSPFDNLLLIGSFGATAVIIYGIIDSPLARPKNVLFGHVLSALIGVTCYRFCGDTVWISAAVAVSTSILVMQLTHTVHPPGGATALIAVIGSTKIHQLGYFYAFIPVGTGVSIMLLIAFVANHFYPRKKRSKNYSIK